ncbi:MAG TPA: preprotein translocase subunit SecE [Candidatus Saccharimonadales bacterium]|nr:preprotein translocase subunit SecE [Candidatus Saccharimonadales bacterium]
MAKEVASKKPRVLKKVETMRELAERSADNAENAKKPGVIRLTLGYIGAPFRAIGRPFKKPAGKLFHSKPMRILGHILLPRYFRNSWIELRQVTWPSRKQSWQLTSAVIIFATIFGVLIAGVDFGLNKLFKELLLR